jgi:hypothetical protein
MIMRQALVAGAVGVAALAAAHSTAVAQVVIETPGFGFYAGPAYRDYYYYDEPRVYGYRYYYDGYDVKARERFNDRQRCGRRAHWNGEVCVPGRRP